MKSGLSLTLLSMAILSHAFCNAKTEEALIKLELNKPVVYQCNMTMRAEQKTAAGLAEVGKGSMTCALVFNTTGTDPHYELLATPKMFKFDLNVGGCTVSYDTELALKTNSIQKEKELVESIIGHTFHIPLTDDPKVGDSQDFYVLKLFNNEDPQSRIGVEDLKETLQAINPGISYVAGEKKEFDITSGRFWEKAHVVRTITHVDEAKVIMKEEISSSFNSFNNQENPEDGGYAVKLNGTVEKIIQRSNWLFTSAEGSVTVEIIEIPGHEGKQLLQDGDLLFTIKGHITASQPDASGNSLTAPFARTGS